jgi:hypothetical protein
MKALIVLALLLPGFVGCAQLGLATPKGFDQQLAEAYGVHTAVVSATATALTSGALTSAEAAQVQTQERSARAMLDAAKAVEQTNPTGASNDLVLATTALSALQAYLNSQTKGK